MSVSHTVVVRILDRDYQVACPPEQEGGLLAAARQLDKQMRSVRDSGKVVGIERIAVMVALNTTYELLSQQQSGSADAATNEHLKRLADRIDDALVRYRQIEIE